MALTSTSGFGLTTNSADPLGLGNNTETLTPRYSVDTSDSYGSGSNDFWGSFTLGDLGKYGLGIYSILSNNKNNNKALDFAKQQLQYNKDLSAANYLQNATGWANQQLWNAQAMYNFDPVQGAQYANNLKGSFENLNTAGSKLGLNGSLDTQINSLNQYTQLKDSAQG